MRYHLVNDITTILFLACLLTISLPVNADEWWTQLYAGAGLTEKHNAHVELPQAGISGVHKQLCFDSAALIGIRESYWPVPYIGVGVDISHFFGPNQKRQISSTLLCVDGDGCSTSPELIKKFNNRVTAIAPIFAVRYPLNMLQHQMQPYLGIGPTLFIAQLRDTDNFIPAGQSSTSRSVGIKAFGGLNLLLSDQVGAFLEYQYHSFRARTCYNNQRVVEGLTLGETQGKETFTIHSIVVGISLSFSTLFPQYR